MQAAAPEIDPRLITGDWGGWQPEGTPVKEEPTEGEWQPLMDLSYVRLSNIDREARVTMTFEYDM